MRDVIMVRAHQIINLHAISHFVIPAQVGIQWLQDYILDSGLRQNDVLKWSYLMQWSPRVGGKI